MLQAPDVQEPSPCESARARLTYLPDSRPSLPPDGPQYRTHKVIYRKYAGLYFSMCIDVSDNELVLLEAIHLFVEILDHYFENVCELDLVFNFHKARTARKRTGSRQTAAGTAKQLIPDLQRAGPFAKAAEQRAACQTGLDTLQPSAQSRRSVHT